MGLALRRIARGVRFRYAAGTSIAQRCAIDRDLAGGAVQFVIDKSYLQGAPTETVQRLCEEHTVLFTETLFYELLTTDKSKRNACFAKLSVKDTPVTLIPRPGPLLRYENEHRRAASPLIDHRVADTFRFNQEFASGTFQHPPNERTALAEWEQEVEREVETIHEVATGISAWCPSLRTVSDQERPTACEDLKHQACANPDVVRNVYRSLALESFACASLLDPSWVLFRWIQSRLLFALDYIARYGFAVRDEVPSRIEHDIHDIQYVLFGCLCGALATDDHDIMRNFRLACPKGTLLSLKIS